jgi:hypothetical protein
LNFSEPEILQEVKALDKDARLIKKDILKICWYMRGMSYSEGMMLTWEDREIAAEIVKENLETTKKTGLPFF